MKRIQIIFDSRERFVSQSQKGFHNDHQAQESIDIIFNAINELGYDCVLFGGVEELVQVYKHKNISRDDIYLNLSDGLTQEYSRVQIPILCDLLGIKYSGGGPFAVALATNKYYACLAAKKLNIPVSNSILVLPEIPPDDLALNELTFPVILKPNSKGSSIGINNKSICNSNEEIRQLLDRLISKFSEVLIEEYVQGYDATNFIIGNGDNILLNEVVLALHNNILYNENEVMSIEDYALGRNSYVSPDGILSKNTIKNIKSYTQKIVNHFGTYDFSRLDYRVNKNGKIKFLEINTVPGIRPGNQVGTICSKLNINFKDFIQLIVKAFLDRIDTQ